MYMDYLSKQEKIESVADHRSYAAKAKHFNISSAEKRRRVAGEVIRKNAYLKRIYKEAKKPGYFMAVPSVFFESIG